MVIALASIIYRECGGINEDYALWLLKYRVVSNIINIVIFIRCRKR